MQATEARGDRLRLTFDQQHLLEQRVLPTARRWIQTYDRQSSMYQHALKTLAYWGEA